MAYRSDLEALEARHAALEAEVAERVRARDEAARMLGEARAKQREEALAADWAAGGPAQRRRRGMVIALSIGAAALLCGVLLHHAMRPSPREVRLEAAIRKIDQFTDQMCACKDKACAEKVNDAMTRWGQEVAHEEPSFVDRIDEKTQARISDIVKRLSDCMTKAFTVEPVGEAQVERPE